jgi:hypothetical protein
MRIRKSLLRPHDRRYTSSGAFQSIRFIVQTGSDDIRSDSSAAGELFSVNGQPLQTLSLKAHNADAADDRRIRPHH